MRKTVKIVCILLVMALIVVMIITNNASANYNVTLNPSAGSSTVASGNSFSVTMNFGQTALSTQGVIRFDNSLFDYVSYQDQRDLNVNESGNGELSFAFFCQEEQNPGIDHITLYFRAKSNVQGTGAVRLECNENLIFMDTEGAHNGNNLGLGDYIETTITVTAPVENPPVVDPPVVDPPVVDPPVVDPPVVDPPVINPPVENPPAVDPAAGNPVISPNTGGNSNSPLGASSLGTASNYGTPISTSTTNNGTIITSENSSSSANNAVPSTGESEARNNRSFNYSNTYCCSNYI